MRFASELRREITVDYGVRNCIVMTRSLHTVVDRCDGIGHSSWAAQDTRKRSVSGALCRTRLIPKTAVAHPPNEEQPISKALAGVPRILTGSSVPSAGLAKIYTRLAAANCDDAAIVGRRLT